MKPKSVFSDIAASSENFAIFPVEMLSSGTSASIPSQTSKCCSWGEITWVLKTFRLMNTTNSLGSSFHSSAKWFSKGFWFLLPFRSLNRSSFKRCSCLSFPDQELLERDWPHRLYDLPIGTLVCSLAHQHLLCSTMNQPQPHWLSSTLLSLSLFFHFPAWDPSRMQCPDEVWWMLSRGDSVFFQYLWQWFFEQPKHSFMTLECTSLFYLKACFTPFTPFYSSLKLYLLSRMWARSPLHLCITFSYPQAASFPTTASHLLMSVSCTTANHLSVSYLSSTHLVSPTCSAKFIITLFL